MKKQSRIEMAMGTLQDLGLNSLEAQVYLATLQCSEPMTAYRISQVVGKPAANVYAAVANLESLGAITIQEGAARLCIPVEVNEFIAQVQRNVASKADKARAALAGIQVKQEPESVSQMSNPSAVLERASLMLSRAKVFLVIDVFPQPLKELFDDIVQAANRGVTVWVQAYEPIRIPGIDVVVAYDSERVMQFWKSQQLNLVADAKESLLALFSNGLAEVRHATWSNALYLSCIMHAGLVREHTFHRIMSRQGKTGFPTWLNRILQAEPFFHTVKLPGQQKLFEGNRHE